jgi:hypothetical protein
MVDSKQLIFSIFFSIRLAEQQYERLADGLGNAIAVADEQ